VLNIRRTLRVRLPLLALGFAVAAACSSDAHFGCSPTPTCSLRDARFSPPVDHDAGVSVCDQNHSRCSVAQISAGGLHSCAVTDGSSLLCWGDNSQGQLGRDLEPLPDLDAGFDGGLDDRGRHFIHVLDRVVQVAAGGAHTCALLADGTVRCWGRALEGQVDGRTDRASVDEPTTLPISGITQIAAGALHTCALQNDGTDPGSVICWGSAQYGQVGGDGSPSPHPVPGLDGPIQVATGARHSCALLADPNRVACWGELIDGAGASYVSATPIAIDGLDHPTRVVAGGGQSCAIDGTKVMCWGANASGQLGDGTTRASATPLEVLGLDRVTSIGDLAAGGGEVDGDLVGHSCVFIFGVDGSQILCWGRNAEGQLGVPASGDRRLIQPVQHSSDDVDVAAGAKQLALGALHSCVSMTDGEVYCWGDNRLDQVGPVASNDDQMTTTPGTPQEVRRFGDHR
jgi:alpha-tubulin suppressor-like RCC1 family protein